MNFYVHCFLIVSSGAVFLLARFQITIYRYFISVIPDSASHFLHPHYKFFLRLHPNLLPQYTINSPVYTIFPLTVKTSISRVLAAHPFDPASSARRARRRQRMGREKRSRRGDIITHSRGCAPETASRALTLEVIIRGQVRARESERGS